MKKLIPLLLIALISSLLTANAQSKDEKQVAAAVEQLKQAMLSGERQSLEAIVSGNLSYGHSSGKVEDKNTFVETLVSGQSDFVTMELANQTIQVTGNTAIVRHQLSGETNDGGKPGAVKLGVMLVWQKQSGNWKLLARQAYKL